MADNTSPRPWSPPGPSVIDDGEWPDKLLAKAVRRDGGDVRLHGYALLGDLARNFSYSDVVYVSIRGEEPSAEESVLFDLALTSLSSMTVNEGAVHLGVLAKLCGASTASALAAAAVCAADTSRQMVSDHSELVRWLADAHDAPPPPQFIGDAADDAYRDALRTALAGRATAPSLARPFTTRAARIALLHDSGLHSLDHIEAAVTVGLWNGVLPEVLMAKAQDMRRYPALLPPFRYIEDAEP